MSGDLHDRLFSHRSNVLSKRGATNSSPARKPQPRRERPSKEQACAAVRTLIRWAGDDPDREGLLDTPDRVVRSYEEYYSGYTQDPVDILRRTFDENRVTSVVPCSLLYYIVLFSFISKGIRVKFTC